MNKKFFYAAVAAAALTACNSEDALESVATQPAEIQADEIVGAKLASTGLNVLVNKDGATRANENGWQSTDKLGLAWVNNPVASGAAITTDQLTDYTYANVKPEVYANNILSTEDGSSFATTANIYEGTYFVYSPWAYTKKANVMTFSPNVKVQKDSVNTERFKNLPWISGLKTIKADENIENGEFDQNFKISPIANTLRVKTTAMGTVAEALKDYNLAVLEIQNATTPSFANTVEINPSRLAKYTLDADGKEVVPTDQEMDDAIKSMMVGAAYTNSIQTVVDPVYGKVAKNNELRVFALPTAAPLVFGPQQVSFTIYVQNAAQTTNIGKFEIYTGAANLTAKNTATLKKLSDALNEPQALFAKSLTEILRNGGAPAALGLELELTADNFYVMINDAIKNLEDWTTAVTLWNALGKTEPAVFTLAGEVEFDGDILTPDAGVIVKKGTGFMSVKEGVKITLPEALKGDPTAYPCIKVKNGAELTVAHKTQTTESIITFGTEAKTAEKAEGKIILTKPTSWVNMEGTNNGTVVIEQDAANKDAAATVKNATAGKVVYNITKDLDDNGVLAKIKTTVDPTAGFNYIAITGAELKTAENLSGLFVELKGDAKLTNTATAAATVAGVEVTGVNNVINSAKDITLANGATIAKGADLTVNIGTSEAAATFKPGANVNGEGMMTVAGNGTVSGPTAVAATIELTIKPGVKNEL